MTLDELKAYLDQLDASGDAQVYLSVDPEGNEFSPLEGFDVGYTAEADYRIDEYYDDDADDPGNMQEIVVLWPV